MRTIHLRCVVNNVTFSLHAPMPPQLLREQSDPLAFSRGNTEIEAVVLIDRAVDLITPLCSQLTYEGLIDEL